MKTMKELIKEATKKGYDVIITDTDGLCIEKSYNDKWIVTVDEYCVMCEYTIEEVEAMEVVGCDWDDSDGILFIDTK